MKENTLFNSSLVWAYTISLRSFKTKIMICGYKFLKIISYERDIMQNENVFKFQKKKNQVVVTTTTNNIRNCCYMYKALPKSQILFYF